MHFPKVSIITPLFNSEYFLKEYFENILLINYPNLEIILVDGLSSDNSITIINSYKEKINIILLSEKDKGIYDAMNKGIDISNGEYIYFMGADDCLYNPDVFLNIFSNESNLRYDFIYGKFNFKNTNKIRGGERNNRNIFLNNICHQAIIYQKLVFNKIGKYNISYPICADYDLNIRCFNNKDIKIKYIDLVIGSFLSGGTSFCGCDNNFKKLQKKLIIDNLGYFTFFKHYLNQKLLLFLKKKRLID